MPVADVLAGPIRGELLGAERLAERARAIAAAQHLHPPGAAGRRTPLLARVDDTRRVLADARARLVDATQRDMDVGPAGEWLLDNFHVVEEHIREVRESLPRSYYGELRELAAGPLAGYPRVYEIAVTLIGHSEARIGRENVDLFVDAFQEVAPLAVGELWAVPAMLRLGLIESVRRMALRTVQRLDEVEFADRWAVRLRAVPGRGGNPGDVALARFVATHPPLTPVFVSRLVHQLRLADEAFAPLVWLEQWIAEDGMSADEAAARSSDRLALTQVMTANSITSLRAIGRLDWKAFVERQSVMETVLRGDPAGIYVRMTFATRDHYRHVVERIAKRTGQTETAVAEAVVRLAEDGGRRAPDDPGRGHVGYYLVDAGLPALEAVTDYRPHWREAVHRWVLRHPNFVFVGGIVGGTLAALLALFQIAGPAASASWSIVLGVAILALLPANEIAVSVVNRLVTAFLPPRVLPKLDLAEHGGIPAQFRTAVVVPTLFGSIDAVRDALDHLEVQFLANREAHLHFAVLGDFTDAPTETREDDDAILAVAVAGVRALNARYSEGRDDAFYLFHRPRRWNPQQGVWMGWERKRGKLAAFNQFLRGGARDAFSTIIGDVTVLHGVRYVITLDADTVLPPDAAPLLIGALAHPLNRAVFDERVGRVVRGYGILQPRVGVSLPSAHRSRFAAINSGHPGVDPYTTAVSDVYQDLYGEGSFTGKGIYDVDAFERATHGRFPENTLLSHDLIEGSYARAGLATDVEVYDDYPTRYLTFTRRKHRWIRGDWQLLRWLTPRVPGPGGEEPNRLSVLSRWKLFDNLRRSVVEIAQFAFLVAGWTILPGSPLRWTLLGLLAIAAPWIVSTLLAAVRPPLDKSWRAYYAAIARDALTSAKQVALAVTILPHQAWISADAIVRSLWRVLVSRRFLLEWQTASQTEHVISGAARDVWRTMWPAVALAVAALLLSAAVAVERGAVERGWNVWPLALAVVPLVALWIASPAVAHALSAPAIRRERRVSPARRAEVMRYALLHWRFFDRFVSADTNWLAPDNFQEDPEPVIAMRTSPTNIGLQLLATVSAYDLGFVTAEQTAERLERAFRSLERMRRFRGHFYNWYDLHDLRVLEPAYVSTVDSGNLAGHLIAIRQACLAMVDEPLFDARVWRALDAAIGLVDDEIAERAIGGSALAAAASQAQRARAALADAGRDADVRATLAAVAEPLAAARRALETEVSAPVAAGASSGWLDWTLDLIAQHQSRLTSVHAEPVTERDGYASTALSTFGTLAEESSDSAALLARFGVLAHLASAYVTEMDFGFLFDHDRELFAIGYQETSHTLDSSSYDLLASEARLASFVAIAKNDVPVDHWFRLGRTLTHERGATALVSWSGSMFEYLMPVLVMRAFPFTVLDQTYQGAVRRQVEYAGGRGVPWGVSESAYNLRDRFQTYQYRAFGVPGLALKRGLGRDLVIAPYATALTMSVDPARAMSNLAALERVGALGAYGFYDAVDYTRPDPGARYAVVRNYMAHHVGMSLVAFTNALTANVWQRRFHADPLVRSAELLLHERIPRRLVFQETQAASTDEALPDPELAQPAVREIETADTPQPRVALLGHLPYTIMVSNGGSGYSRYEGLAVTRWRADATRDNTGQFCYVKDLATARVWSAAHQPVCANADWYRASFATDRVTFHRADGDVETRTEIAVVPGDAAEVRRVTVTNNGRAAREIELTSYAEVVLAPPDMDRAHPAFANLFVETEWHGWCSAITATRRPRSATERQVWGVHVVSVDRASRDSVTCETDRARFLGRGRSTLRPTALDAVADGPLAGTTGAVLDPIFAIRARVRVAPGQSASVAFTTLVAPTRAEAFKLADRYRDPTAAERALDLAWTAAQVELRELHVTPADAAVYQDLAGHLFYGDPRLTTPADERALNRGSQPLLWTAGLSGDWPILLATIDSIDGLPTLRQLLAAHQYWRRRGMLVDLVVLNTRPPTYLQDVHDRISAAVLASSEAGVIDQPGGIFVRRADILEGDALRMLRATARVHIACDGRSVAHAIRRSDTDGASPSSSEAVVSPAPLRSAGRITPASAPAIQRGRERSQENDVGADRRTSRESAAERSHSFRAEDATIAQDGALLLDNGLGGLTADGDYEIRLRDGTLPPAPWANVIANPVAGFVVTERGAGFTWAENSFFYRLTPWHNDPVSDPAGEVLYLRDEANGELWSPTPAPIHHDTPYTVRHGGGVSTFAHEHADIATELTLGIAEHDPVKLSLLRITNRSEHPRRLTLTAYVEWTLGAQREHTRHQVHTTFDESRGIIFARNCFDPQFAEQVAFCSISEPVAAHTGDRREFLGRNGTTGAPAALDRSTSLRGATGPDLDPCAALQCVIELAPGESRTVAVALGAAVGEEDARHLAEMYGAVDRAQTAVAQTAATWRDRLSVIQVRTPDPAFDAMLNRWALYQALACRMWARSALYQSSGAYGFRDQLQDVMAFVHAEPAVARAHILRATARQFVEGDVQHWWHPQSGRGVRTRFSDDLAWLPYVVEHYVRVTGDASVLDEYVPFLSMRSLAPDEHELYDLPQVTDEHATVYEHCLRALRRACTSGAHGLPLIGIGDWNDGMSRVGIEGRGESVWLAWFLITTLRAFAPYAEARGDDDVAREFRQQADAYVAAVETNGWDGAWYRRAYFDNGTPLGSASSDECHIDAIAQSWSVISGAGDPARQQQAMQSLEEHLVREDARLVMLLTPPFDETPNDPGYIKGYLPGVRENGAQYTHAALWAVLATALRGDGDRAFELFQMINPLTHARTPDEVATYKVEPYVVAADVYTADGQLGRGGWTWYTGSASWMYRVALEAILGFTKCGDTLVIDPCVPRGWPGFSIEYRYGAALYDIRVEEPDAFARDGVEVSVDGHRLATPILPLVDDGVHHDVVVRPRRTGWSGDRG